MSSIKKFILAFTAAFLLALVLLLSVAPLVLVGALVVGVVGGYQIPAGMGQTVAFNSTIYVVCSVAMLVNLYFKLQLLRAYLKNKARVR